MPAGGRPLILLRATTLFFTSQYYLAAAVVRLRLPISRLLFAMGLVAALPGCGGDDASSYRIRGGVSYEDRPLKAGTVMFQPQAGKSVVGVIQSDGSFELRAPAGVYRVGVVSLPEIPTGVDVWKPGAKLPPPLLPAEYHRPEYSGITVDVKANDDNVVAIALPLEPR